MGWEYMTVEVARRYYNRAREYRWEAVDLAASADGWDGVLAAQAAAGWELLTVCVDSYQENNTNTEATAYRLFFKRQRAG
jgi:hypothetical protein